MNDYVVIFASIYDFSADLVVQRLEKAGQKYLRLNKETLSQNKISIDPVTKTMSVFRNNENIYINKVKSIWFRQPVFLRNTPGDKLEIGEQLSRSQWNAFLRGMMIFDDSFWMNWPQSTYAAESKPYQLMIAAKLGFDVPKTIVGNTLVFGYPSSKHHIVKSMDTVLLRENDDCFFTYTTRLNVDSVSEESINSAPLTIQECLDDKLDLRVTVICNKVISVSVKLLGQSIELDWRTRDKTKLEFDDYDLPKDLENRCIELLNSLGLAYGCIDLAKVGGKYYFIEINPTGEWGWLANENRQIDKYISESLINGHKVYES